MKPIVKQICISFFVSFFMLFFYHMIFTNTPSKTDDFKPIPVIVNDDKNKWDTEITNEVTNSDDWVWQEKVINEIKYEDYPEDYNLDLIRGEE